MSIISDIAARLSNHSSAFSDAQKRELDSLAQETDPEIFWSDLLRLGGKLEAKDQLEAASTVFGLAAAQAPEKLAAKAQARLDAVEGRGAVGARIEFHLRRFAREATNPNMILPMMAGTAVYGLAKGLALGRFAAAANPAWWMRGSAGRFGAAALGYGAEVPAFVFSSRLMHGLNSDSPSPPLGREFASAAITLALLKGGGSLAQSGLQRYLGAQASPGLRFATGQAAMFGALYSAHRLEEGLGLRQAQTGATTVTDIFSSMVSLGIGAQLGKRWLGEAFARRQSEFDFRVQARAETLNFAKLLSDRLAPQTFGPTAMQMSAEGSDGPTGQPPGGSKQVQTSASDFRFRQTLRHLRSAGKKWSAMADLVDSMANDVRTEARYTSVGRAWMLNSLEQALKKFGLERNDPDRLWEALTNLAEVRAQKLSQAEYGERIRELEARRPFGEAEARIETGRVEVELMLPPKIEAPETSPVTPELPTPASLPAKLSSYSELAQVGDLASALRLYTIPNIGSPGAKEFEVRLILPSLDQLRWRTQINGEGEMALLDGGKGKHFVTNRGAAALHVEKVEGYNGRFKLKFDGKDLIVDLQGERDRGSNFTRLKLSSQFPASETPITSYFSPWEPRLRQVEIEHAANVGWSTLRLGSGVQWRDILYLSNGDTVELVGSSNFKKATDVEVKHARLHRFGDPADNIRAMDISVSPSKGGAVKILLKEPSGYRLNLEVQFPKTEDRGRHQWKRLRVVDAPPPMHLRWVEGEGGRREPMDSTESDATIRGMAADALFGDLVAIAGLGAEGRSYDTAIWELKDLFEMTWEPDFSSSDFGDRVELVKFRERIGDAFRDAARQNALAKKVLGELEEKYGAASLREEAPRLPSLPPPAPTTIPPPPKPVFVAPQPAPKPAWNPAPKIKAKPAPKSEPTPLDKVERRLTQAANGPMKKVVNSLILELPTFLQSLSSAELRDLHRKHMALLETANQNGSLQQIMISMCVADTAILFMSPELRPQAMDDLTRMTGTFNPSLELGEALMALVRTKSSLAGRKVFSRFFSAFDQRPEDTPALVELRKILFDSARNYAQVRYRIFDVYEKSKALNAEEAAVLRDQLWNTLQLTYMDYVLISRNSIAEALDANYAVMTVLFGSLLGASANLEPAARKAYLEKAGVSVRGPYYRFQPFPNLPFDVMQMELPLLTPPSSVSSEKKPKQD